jgi:hypothetical protein
MPSLEGSTDEIFFSTSTIALLPLNRLKFTWLRRRIPLDASSVSRKAVLNQSSQIIHSDQVGRTKPLFDCFWLPALLKAGIKVNYIRLHHDVIYVMGGHVAT